MAEYIDREVCIEAYCNFMCQRHRNKCGFTTFCDGRWLIENTPAADVAPVVHGRWEFLGPNRLTNDCMCGTCSACKVRCKYIVNKDICPNCGAKMDGGGDNA